MSGRDSAEGDSVWKWRLPAAALILGTACLRVWYLARLCDLDLAPDEAHYWDWSRRLDWSYYSKGPLVAYLIRLGCLAAGEWSAGLVGTQMVAVRLPAVACGALLLAAVYTLAALVYRREGLALLLVGVLLTVPLISAGATLMTIDAPYTCCWAWSLVLGHRALFGGRRWAWPALGLTVGLGILAKYTMVLWFASLGCFLLASPAHRRQLLRPGVWVAAAVAAACAVPIVVWNVRHGWVGARHVQHLAGVGRPGGGLDWLGPLEFAGVQAALLLGFWFGVWAQAMWARAPWRGASDQEQYLWWMSAVTFAVFFGFGLSTEGGEANWAVTAYLSGSVLALGWLAADLRRYGPLRRRLVLGGCVLAGVVGLLLTLHLHLPGVARPVLLRLAGAATPGRPHPVRRLDPTYRLRGWRTLAAAVDARVRELRRRGVEPVVACGSWLYPGELGFYCTERPELYCVGAAFGCRHSQYDVWTPNPLADPGRYRGRTFLFVGEPHRLLHAAFERVGPTESVAHAESGVPVAEWKLTVCSGYCGFPADELPENGSY